MLFTKEQQEFIIKNYKTMQYKDIAKELGDFKSSQVSLWLNHNGYKKRVVKSTKKNIFSNKDIDFMIENYETMSYREIAEYLGFSERQVRGKINHLGLKKNRSINESYFDKIDSSNKAYFLGLIYADGWVVCNDGHYELGIELNSKDKYILELFNNELGGNCLISHKDAIENHTICGINCNRGESDVIRVFSKSIVESLINHDVLPNKTKHDNIPNVSDEFFFDFLRGYIDGDGCFYQNKGHIYMHITCGMKKPLECLKERLINYGIETNIYKLNDRKYRIYCTNQNSMVKLVGCLYYTDSLLFLYRKYNKIKSLLSGSAA